MKMTLIDYAIVFAVANVMLVGITTKTPVPDFYEDVPFCNFDKNAPPADADPRCAQLKENALPPASNASAPIQTPLK